MKQITKIRKAVCIMANRLRKSGYTLSEAFRKAWKSIRRSITLRAAGVTFENRQERLEFLKQFRADELTVTLEREAGSMHDSNAIQIIAHILPIARKTVIGYIPRRFSRELGSLLDMGIHIKASLMQVIGGYSYKESLGALVNVAV